VPALHGLHVSILAPPKRLHCLCLYHEPAISPRPHLRALMGTCSGNKRLTARHSESMGSSADLCCLQHWGARLLRHLLLFVSHHRCGQTAQAGRVVSGFSRSIRRCTAPASHTRLRISWTWPRGSRPSNEARGRLFLLRGSRTSRLTPCFQHHRWTLGSILFLSSFAAVMGPWAYLQHLASTPRLPFTAAYFGSLGMTLYFSVGVSLGPPSSSYLGKNTDAEPLSSSKARSSRCLRGSSSWPAWFGIS